MPVVSFPYMVAVIFVFIEDFHNIGCRFQIIDGFKQRNDINTQPAFLPPAQQEQTKNLQYVQSTVALTDDITVTTIRAIKQLNVLNGPDTFQCIPDYPFFCYFNFRPGGYSCQYFYFFIVRKRGIIGGYGACFTGNSIEYFGMYGALLSYIQRGKV